MLEGSDAPLLVGVRLPRILADQQLAAVPALNTTSRAFICQMDVILEEMHCSKLLCLLIRTAKQAKEDADWSLSIQYEVSFHVSAEKPSIRLLSKFTGYESDFW